jgi:hypothetical protein
MGRAGVPSGVLGVSAKHKKSLIENHGVTAVVYTKMLSLYIAG